jgi:peroxiredoxin
MSDNGSKSWKNSVLLAAGIYNLVFAFVVVFFPRAIFDYFQLTVPLYLPFWQAIGLVFGAFGVGYLLAASKPIRHWNVVLVGFLFKLFGPLLLAYSILQGNLPQQFYYFAIFNGLIWLVPFYLILREAYEKIYLADSILIDMFSESEKFTLDLFETNEGMNLEEMSHKWPVMLVFLRHFGCTFCREALEEISHKRNNIEVKGTRIVIVHMVDEESAHKELMKYELEDIPHISDPECILYKKIKLKTGTLNQLFGLKVWVRGVVAGMVKGHGIGKEMGDSTQMPGVFLLRKGEIIKRYIHQTAADRPDYEDLANCPY